MILNARKHYSLVAAILLLAFAIVASPNVFAREPLDPAATKSEQALQPVPDTPDSQENSVHNQEPPVTRMVRVEYANLDDLTHLIMFLGVSYSSVEKPKTLVLSGPEESVALALDAIEQLDVPPPPVKNVEVIVYLIVAAKEGGALTNLEPCGPQLEPVTEQLKTVFGLEQFGVIDTLLLRGRDGSSIEASGFLPPFASAGESGQEAPSDYRVQISELEVQPRPDGVARISLNDFTFGTMLSIPSGSRKGPNGEVFTQMSRRDMGISADLDVQEGQMAVVGKANLSMEGDVVFIVVSAQVVPE